MDTACRHSKGIQICPEHRIIDLEYIDVVLFANSYDEMQIILNNVSATAVKIELIVNVNRTKAFSSYVQEANKMSLFISSLSVEEALDFKYLGPL
ncbi:unnamed protein product [Dracunculus medinensis]|uniref:FBD domain-containing protein n=1 Tax=Dracunculus medinensis TaxID=318479 RepID=A0A0N4UPF6_DRAME|nr:unnamed protein product [Dracunculus medinensis]